MGLDPGLLGGVLSGPVAPAPVSGSFDGLSAGDVGRFGWELLKDLAYGESDWERAAEGVREVQEEGFSGSAVGKVLGGAGLGLAGLVPGVGDVRSLFRFLSGGSDVVKAGGTVGRIGDVTGVSAPGARSVEDLLAAEGRLGDAALMPESAVIRFDRITKDEAGEAIVRWGERERLGTLSGEDLDVEPVNDMLDRMARAIVQNETRANSKVRTSVERWDVEATDLRDLGFESPVLLSSELPGDRGANFRPLMRAIMNGDFDRVRQNLAVQTNNVLNALDESVFFTSFYPFKHSLVVQGSVETGIPEIVLSTLMAISSARRGPIDELRHTIELSDAAGKYVSIVDDVAVLSDKVPGKFRADLEGYVGLLNNPNFIENKVKQLALKTYQYNLLSLEPRIPRAHVVDRVDANLRMNARQGESIGYEFKPERVEPRDGNPDIPGQIRTGTEYSLATFPEQVVAQILNVPTWAVQEQVWPIWRMLRDYSERKAAIESSLRTSSGIPAQDLVAQIRLPQQHISLFLRNQQRLMDEVAAGGSASQSWVVASSGLLRPRADLPTANLLTPEVRNPTNVETLEATFAASDKVAAALKAGGVAGTAALAMIVAAAAEEEPEWSRPFEV